MRKRNCLLLAALLLVALLAACQAEDTPTVTTTVPVITAPVEHVDMVVSEQTITQLEQYPQLKSADLSGSTCYEAILAYSKDHPQVVVTYTVKLDSLEVKHDTTELVLDPGACSYDTLAENLAYLPRVATVRMPRTNYTPEQLVALQGLYPDIAWDFSVILMGQELTAETTELNLSVLEPERVEEAAAILRLFPSLTYVELMDAAGQTGFTQAQVKCLQDGAPNALVNYTFQLFGKTVSTSDERIEFVKQDIGNEGEAELRAALDILQSCTYFLLDDCGLDNEVLAKVREDYPRTEVVWRIHVWSRSWLTDTDTLRAVYHVDDNNCAPFQYCTKTKYIDMGHNEELTDISWIANMPDLEIVILSGSPITDLTPFENCTKLVFLELAWCGKLEDVTPLAGCTSLANVNLSYTDVSDISALYELPLEQLCAVHSDIPWSNWQNIIDLHPDCTIRYEGNQCYGTGWRYKKSGAYTEIYAKVREVFDLDAVDQLIANGAK